jgi:hypothetical protein
MDDNDYRRHWTFQWPSRLWRLLDVWPYMGIWGRLYTIPHGLSTDPANFRKLLQAMLNGRDTGLSDGLIHRKAELVTPATITS